MKKHLLPFVDYQRIFQVVYSVLQASEIAITHRACVFFTAAGTLILRDHYHLPATISAGCMALMVHEEKTNVLVYGRKEDGNFVFDRDAFHAWVECDGWLIDFMAPIMGIALREDGVDWNIPRKMLQKPLLEGRGSLKEVQRQGDFYVEHDAMLANSLLDDQSSHANDLLKICLAWYRRPPKTLGSIGMGNSHGPTKILSARAPSIDGIW
ncbi:DUF2026 family protein [Herbaspirillum rhizosphaerae]|uniref:DUF2026 family protein n=1 Tax=Herbaspirillum rhizosphaerae TaxID=346179 RepID=UPI00067E157B|nr:DUF2026 family protein [Herbaspirillum rhizosphaerae]